VSEALHVHLLALERELARRGHGPEALAEIEGHLEDAIATLRAAGLDEASATQTALERFGSVEDVVRAFVSNEEGAPMLRKLATLLAVVNTATALLITTSSFWHPTDRPGIFALLVCALVVGHSALVLAQPARPPWGDVQLIGALLLVVSGTVAVLRTIHIGQITGDFEYWTITFAMGYVAQGALSAWMLRSGPTRRHIAAAG
jgi:hypothetical protein